MYQKAMTTIETVERVHIAPLRARVDAMLDQVQLMTDKVRHAHESVSTPSGTSRAAGSAVAGAVKSKAWPIVGIIQGLKSVANSVMGNGRARTGRQVVRSDVGFCCIRRRNGFTKNRAFSRRYERCNK